MPSAPLWKQRRLAERAKRVQARRSAESPVIAAYGSTLHPKADAYIASFDIAARYEAEWKRKLRKGKDSVAALRAAMSAWLPLLARDVPALIGSKLRAGPAVPDDVIAAGGRLVASITEARNEAGTPLPYRDEAIQALEAARTTASTDWAEAEAADATYQKLLALTRAAFTEFDAELKAFRQTLAATFGRNDKDFQRLRAEKVSAAEDEGEEDEGEAEGEDEGEDDEGEEGEEGEGEDEQGEEREEEVEESEEEEGEGHDVEVPSVETSLAARKAPEKGVS